MPNTYVERLKIPARSEEEVKFSTPNGLPVACGYKQVLMTSKGPMVEFVPDQILFENVTLTETGRLRHKHPDAYYVEYRSKDYCSVKLFEQKRDVGNMRAGHWYVSALDLTSDKYPNLIEPLKRRSKHEKRSKTG